MFGACLRRLEIKERPDWLIGFGQAIQQTCGGRRTCARKELDDAEAGYPIAQILGPAQKRKHIFNMCGFFNMCGLEKLEAAEFHEWDIAPCQFDLERATVIGRPEDGWHVP